MAGVAGSNLQPRFWRPVLYQLSYTPNFKVLSCKKDFLDYFKKNIGVKKLFPSFASF